MQHNVKEIAVFGSASEGFSLKNIHCSVKESLERFEDVVSTALDHGIKVRGYVSCVCGCPYDGAVSPLDVAKVNNNIRSIKKDIHILYHIVSIVYCSINNFIQEEYFLA